MQTCHCRSWDQSSCCLFLDFVTPSSYAPWHLRTSQLIAQSSALFRIDWPIGWAIFLTELFGCYAMDLPRFPWSDAEEGDDETCRFECPVTEDDIMHCNSCPHSLWWQPYLEAPPSLSVARARSYQSLCCGAIAALALDLVLLELAVGYLALLGVRSTIRV